MQCVLYIAANVKKHQHSGLFWFWETSQCAFAQWSEIHWKIEVALQSSDDEKEASIAHCTLHTAHCTLHTAHCTLHISHCTLPCTSLAKLPVQFADEKLNCSILPNSGFDYNNSSLTNNDSGILHILLHFALSSIIAVPLSQINIQRVRHHFVWTNTGEHFTVVDWSWEQRKFCECSAAAEAVGGGPACWAKTSSRPHRLRQLYLLPPLPLLNTTFSTRSHKVGGRGLLGMSGIISFSEIYQNRWGEYHLC